MRKTSVSNGGLGMCQSNDFYLIFFTLWFDLEKAGTFGFAITKY